MINHTAPFVQVSCGQSFTLALDSKGGAHAWGEVQFERENPVWFDFNF